MASNAEGWVATGLKIGIELEPIIKAEDPNDMGVLETTIGDPPGVSVVPAMDIPWVSGTTGWLLMVVTIPTPGPEAGISAGTEGKAKAVGP